jgi:hypothetical protein
MTIVILLAVNFFYRSHKHFAAMQNHSLIEVEQ